MEDKQVDNIDEEVEFMMKMLEGGNDDGQETDDRVNDGYFDTTPAESYQPYREHGGWEGEYQQQDIASLIKSNHDKLVAHWDAMVPLKQKIYPKDKDELLKTVDSDIKSELVGTARFGKGNGETSRALILFKQPVPFVEKQFCEFTDPSCVHLIDMVQGCLPPGITAYALYYYFSSFSQNPHNERMITAVANYMHTYYFELKLRILSPTVLIIVGKQLAKQLLFDIKAITEEEFKATDFNVQAFYNAKKPLKSVDNVIVLHNQNDIMTSFMTLREREEREERLKQYNMVDISAVEDMDYDFEKRNKKKNYQWHQPKRPVNRVKEVKEGGYVPDHVAIREKVTKACELIKSLCRDSNKNPFTISNKEYKPEPKKKKVVKKTMTKKSSSSKKEILSGNLKGKIGKINFVNVGGTAQFKIDKPESRLKVFKDKP